MSPPVQAEVEEVAKPQQSCLVQGREGYVTIEQHLRSLAATHIASFKVSRNAQ